VKKLREIAAASDLISSPSIVRPRQIHWRQAQCLKSNCLKAMSVKAKRPKASRIWQIRFQFGGPVGQSLEVSDTHLRRTVLRRHSGDDPGQRLWLQHGRHSAPLLGAAIKTATKAAEARLSGSGGGENGFVSLIAPEQAALTSGANPPNTASFTPVAAAATSRCRGSGSWR